MRAVMVLAALLAQALSACITVNLHFNFPQKELEQKLYEMEKEVRGEGTSDAPKPEGNKAFFFDPQLMLMEGPEVQDKEPKVDVNTPAIRKIKEQRTTRHAQIKEHFAAGRLGEGNDALVAERELSGLDGKAKAELKRLVKAENDDREALIREVARANNLEGEENLGRVRLALAKTFRRAAGVGVPIQTRSGDWRKKTAQDQEKLDKGEDVEK